MRYKVLYPIIALSVLVLGLSAQKPVINLLGSTSGHLQEPVIPDSTQTDSFSGFQFPVDSLPELEPLKPGMDEIFPEIKKEKL